MTLSLAAVRDEPDDFGAEITDPQLDRATAAAQRLEVVSQLAVKLSELRDPQEIAHAVVTDLNSAFGYYLAVMHRLDPDNRLRIIAGAGRLTEEDARFLAWEQSIDSGINGRVARTGTLAMVPDTRKDPDYVGSSHNPGGDLPPDPGSELCVPIKFDGRVWGVLNLEQEQTHGFDEYDVLLVQAVVAQTGAALHRCALIEEMDHSFGQTLAILCDTLENKDEYTAEHAEHVSELALATGTRLGLSGARQRDLRYAALLHDIGKIGIRSELLTKPAALTPEEYAEIQQHSDIGATLLARTPLKQIAPFVRAVHERWDGRGYPDRLAATEIPIEARIVAVCDAWHAMVFDRPYRKALSHAAAITQLTEGAGSQFDPEVVAAFISTIDA